MASLVKNGITLIGLAIVAGLGYYLFVLNGSSGLSESDTQRINEARLASEQFLKELKNIEKFELSDELFADARFQSFVEFTKPVQPLPVGRENPFAPVQ